MKGFNFDDIIKNIIDTTKQSSKQITKKVQQYKDRQNNKKPQKQSKEKRIFKTINPQTIQTTPSIESAFQFVQNILINSQKILLQQKKNKQQKILKIKDKKFMLELGIQPIYFYQTHQSNIIRFQFQLGSESFLQRIERLYQQLHNVENCIQNNIKNYQIFLNTFQIVQQNLLKVNSLYEIVKLKRYLLNQIKPIAFLKEFSQKYNKKQIILKKIAFLKSIKRQRNQLLLNCDNLDKAFYSQKARTKLYIKIKKSSSLINRVKCLQFQHSRLAQIAQKNIEILEKQINNWINNKLSEKQIQKVLILVYYTQKQPLYLQKQLKINWKKYDRLKLILQINKIKEWKKYRYIQDFHTQEKVKLFIQSLLKLISN